MFVSPYIYHILHKLRGLVKHIENCVMLSVSLTKTEQNTLCQNVQNRWRLKLLLSLRLLPIFFQDVRQFLLPQCSQVRMFVNMNCS